MYVYRNTLTGATVITDSILSGNWELVETKKANKKVSGE